VNRAEFSAVYPGAVLAQHFGTTNAQLKVHLGLIVPLHANGTPCVHLRVGGVAGTWQHDRAIVFDDSFVHEVWSNCDAVRVIFQVVVQHPELLRESEL
jgi:aspartyl/asparaginyl beta-hydroxylase (cupin superfamily)